MTHELDNVIEKSQGRIFSVTFEKRDGSIRKLTGRLGVKKHLAGGACTLDRNDYLIVYDLINNGYRAVRRDAIKRVKAGGQVYYSNDAEFNNRKQA